MSTLVLTEGCWARVRLLPDCPGDGKPHHPAENGARVHVSNVSAPGDHCVRGNYQGAPWQTITPPPGGLGIGRYFRPDELEVLPPGHIDATTEDEAERQARLRREVLGG